MKNFDSRTYSINDFLEWSNNGQLILSPGFQRRNVWNKSARSFLMDTILRSKPMPKVFIRQKLDPVKRITIREVVDGQQRLRTILSYLDDGFKIRKDHNATYGGLYYSQLPQIDEEIQAQILNYEISVDLLVNMSNPEVLDVFSRLNSYAITLNEQEKINALNFGPFKKLADSLGHDLYDFWLNNKILTENKILRMSEISLTADILIATISGINSKKKIKSFYNSYEKSFDYDLEDLKSKFLEIIRIIELIFPETLKTTEFRRVHLFYSLFLSLYHLEYGISNLQHIQHFSVEENISRIRLKLDRVELFFLDDSNLSNDEQIFLNDCRRATTDQAVRVRRSNFLVDLMINE